MARVDIAILREIVRVIGARGEVPDSVDVSKKHFQVTYLEDHKQRIEEALRRNDRNHLNMLYGQLESKVKYKLVRGAAANGRERPSATKTAKAPAAAAKRATTPAANTAASPRKAPARPKQAAAKKAPARNAAKKKK